MLSQKALFFFFFNDTATTEIYTLSLHDALPISPRYQARQHFRYRAKRRQDSRFWPRQTPPRAPPKPRRRSEEHTSELQSRLHLVCRLLLEKKKNTSTSTCARRSACRSSSILRS